MANTDGLDRTVFISDNLPFLKALDTESVDLVCIDPPFGKNQTFSSGLKPPLTANELRIEGELMAEWGIHDPASAYEVGVEYPDQRGATANFADIWSFRRQVYQEWFDGLEITFPAAYWLIHAARYSHGEQTAAYIAFMVERMLEIRRILKPTGSVYLHCDHEADAYLRQMMDAVFGQTNFRTAIKWARHTSRQKGSQHEPKSWGSTIDTILFYAKSSAARLKPWRKMTEDEREAKFNRVDEQGRRYYDDSSHIWRTPNMGARPNLCYTWEKDGHTFTNPHPSGWRLSKERLEQEYAKGNIVIMYGGPRGPRLQRRMYEDDWRGTTVGNLWDDINPVGGHEATGYPTQKPQALARRIIDASTEEGDLVLDCFAGCAYVPVAAELAGRRWIACDMSPRAWTVVRRQFHKQPDLRIQTEGELAETAGVTPRFEDERVIRVRGPNQLPERTTSDEATIPMRIRALSAPAFRQKPLETGDAIWDVFIDHYGPDCWYCGQRKAADRRELHLDHIEPNKRDGTNDDCWNRALACSPCNSDKSNTLSVAQTMDKALEAGRIATLALREEQASRFETRHRWARERWDSIRPRLPAQGETP